jgi:hypothetical protein
MQGRNAERYQVANIATTAAAITAVDSQPISHGRRGTLLPCHHHDDRHQRHRDDGAEIGAEIDNVGGEEQGHHPQ